MSCLRKLIASEKGACGFAGMASANHVVQQVFKLAFLEDSIGGDAVYPAHRFISLPAGSLIR
jgi:hypothetical protein